ncbi:MAG: hypothetical protein LBQ59_01570 [Candidatus Peribacteria bacterium]|jgi:hypothetical protein|nr:hypothetical protein [Candidatus Peribacteria bacterium]
MLYSLKITKKIFNLCLANGLEGDGHTPPEAIPTQHQQEVIKKAYEDNKHNLDKY